ncbi:MAG: T9SS type A sorting domain-containing protein [candidate division Zixibacteria bacterium]|nr:T9SS type A sorting domain-containing protein [candidate division Zixibacteria bacterium]
MFIDSANNDFHLQQNSPCIGSGRYGDDRGALPYEPTFIDDNRIRPFAAELSDNYPNPFNFSTTIDYYLSHRVEVAVDIYNILGRKVETLVNNEQSAGHYQVVWQANDKASGVYYYKIQAGGYIEMKKMLFLK